MTLDHRSADLLRYAEDHVLVEGFSANSRLQEQMAISNLQGLLVKVKAWMTSNKLRMNNSKMEFVLFGSQVELNKCQTRSLMGGDTLVTKAIV